MDKTLQNYKGFGNSVDTDNSINRLDVDNYLLTPYLHLKLHEAYNEKLTREVSLTKGVYFVSFRLLNNSDKRTLIYNYTYYPISFCCSIVVYFILRNFYIKDRFTDRGYYFVVLDSNFLNITDMDHYIKTANMIDKKGINCMWLFDDVANHFGTKDLYDAKYWLNFTTKLMYIDNTEVMSNIIKLGVNKNFLSYINLIYKDTPLPQDNFGNLSQPEFSVLDSTLFVVEDLEYLIKRVEDKGFIINQGPQKWRGQLNSMNSFHGVLDMDYRESLYNHYDYHRDNLNASLYTCNLGRKHFSFSNIHKNIGNVRWFSTTKRLNSLDVDKRYKNRQSLFQDNYKIIGDLIDKNFNLGSEELQIKLETLLHQQENLFAKNNLSDLKLKFNEASYEMIVKKESDITKLLSNPDILDMKTHVQGDEYMPFVQMFIKNIGANNIAKMILGYFLRLLTNESIYVDDEHTPGIPTLTAFEYVGGLIKNRYIFVCYNNWKKLNKKEISLSEYKNKHLKVSKDFYDDNFNARIGGFFVWCLQSVKLVTQEIDFMIDNPTNVKKKEYYFRVKQEVRKTFIKDNQFVFHLPMKLPMICEPKKYSYKAKEIKLGGYLLNDDLYTDDIFKKKIGYTTPSKLKEKNVVVDMVNKLNRTPYKINIDTLEFVLKFGIEKGIIIDITTKPKLEKFLLYGYKGFTKPEKKEYRSIASKILLERNILSIAQVYSNMDRIFFPVRLDHRTRIYCETDYFDYQKSDLAKGLISFVNPGCIYKYSYVAIKYFKAFGANMFGSGLDKKSLNLRVKWVEDNTDKILKFESNDIVNNAENKTSFVSFCFEYKRFIEFINDKNSVVFYTYLPIQLDASCNGYQHLALLTKEVEIFDKLNLSKSTYDDDPDDFYSYILDKIYEYISKQIIILAKSSNLSDKQKVCIDIYKKLIKAPFERSIVKKTIMTNSYNAGTETLVKNIQVNLVGPFGEGVDTYYTYKDYDVKIYREDLWRFVITMKHVLGRETPKIVQLSKYLSSVVSICTKLCLPIPWNLPSGVEIVESYEIEKKSTLKAFSFIKSKYSFRKFEKASYDLDKQKRATMPNLIHSLDGTSIALLQNNFNVDLYTIHDCFAVTADFVPVLVNKLKSVYISLYSSDNYLRGFDELVRYNISKERGEKIFTKDGKHIFLPRKEEGFKKTDFPDINKVLLPCCNSSIDSSINQSSNIII